MSIRTLGKQSLTYGLGHILARLVTFLLLPLYTNVFSKEEYGIVSLAYAFMGFFLIVYRYGMDTALMKFYVTGDDNERKHYFSTIFCIQALSSFFLSGLLYLNSVRLSPILLGVENDLLVKLVAAILFCDILWNLPILILRSEERPTLFVSFNIVNVILMMIFNILLVVKMRLGIAGVLYGNLGASLSLLIMTLPIVFKRFTFSRITFGTLKRVIRFGLPFLPAGIFTMVMELADRYLLVWLTDTATVGLYSAGYKLGMFGLLLVMGFNMGWTPYFLKQGKTAEAPATFARVTTYFLGLTGFLIISITLWVDYLVRFQVGGYSFFGREFWESTQIVPLILFGYYCFGTYVLQLPGVYMTDQTKWVPVFRGIGAVTNISLNIVLIPAYGAPGAAWATAIAFLVMSLSVFVKTHRSYPVPYHWRGVLFPAIYFGAVILFPLSLIWKIVATLGYPVIWILLIAEQQDRNNLRRILFH